MKLRERWLPLCGTALLVILCTALPFVWFRLCRNQCGIALSGRHIRRGILDSRDRFHRYGGMWNCHTPAH